MREDGTEPADNQEDLNAEEANLEDRANESYEELDAVIEALRPLKPMQAFLSAQMEDKAQRHRQRPTKESVAVQNALEK